MYDVVRSLRLHGTGNDMASGVCFGFCSSIFISTIAILLLVSSILLYRNYNGLAIVTDNLLTEFEVSTSTH